MEVVRRNQRCKRGCGNVGDSRTFGSRCHARLELAHPPVSPKEAHTMNRPHSGTLGVRQHWDLQTRAAGIFTARVTHALKCKIMSESMSEDQKASAALVVAIAGTGTAFSARLPKKIPGLERQVERLKLPKGVSFAWSCCCCHCCYFRAQLCWSRIVVLLFVVEMWKSSSELVYSGVSVTEGRGPKVSSEDASGS